VCRLCADVNVEGLYRGDERDGPGLLSDDISAQDDVGVWLRHHLVKLCVSIPGVFVVADHWPLSISDADGQRLPDTTAVWGRAAGARPPPADVDCTAPREHLTDARLPTDSLAVDRRAFDNAYDAAVYDCSQSWRLQLRQICVGLCMAYVNEQFL